MTDTERMNWLIKNNASLDAPNGYDSKTWAVYTYDEFLGGGAECDYDLRAAIDKAMNNPNNPPVSK